MNPFPAAGVFLAVAQSSPSNPDLHAHVTVPISLLHEIHYKVASPTKSVSQTQAVESAFNLELVTFPHVLAHVVVD